MDALDSKDRSARRTRGPNMLLAGCGGTVVVLMLAAFGYLAWANVLPAPDVDHRVLPSPNGYDACAVAVEGLTVPSGSRPPPASDLKTLRKEVAQARPVLKALSAAVRLPYLTPARNLDSGRQSAHYREATRLLAAAARLELAEGRPEHAMQRALDAMELGAKLGRGGSLLDCKVGDACARSGQEAAERCVSQLSVEAAHRAGARLDGILAQLPEPADAIAENRRQVLLGVRDLLAGRYSAPLSGDPTTWLPSVRERALLLVYPKSWGYGQVDRWWNAMIAELRKPYPQRKLPPRSPPYGDPVLGGGDMVHFSGIQFPFAHVRARLRLLRTELALREYRLRHGAYPATLAQLVPEVTAEVLVDPFCDQPLHYRREGATFKLYSIGPDLKDNVGMLPGARGVGTSSKGDLLAGEFVAIPLRREWFPE